jgi:membrane protease YdiL (CAAX protease family)
MGVGCGRYDRGSSTAGRPPSTAAPSTDRAKTAQNTAFKGPSLDADCRGRCGRWFAGLLWRTGEGGSYGWGTRRELRFSNSVRSPRQVPSRAGCAPSYPYLECPVLAANGKVKTMFKSISTDPRVDRVLLGLGLAFFAVFSVAVVWLYFGQGNAITDGVVVFFAIFSLITLVELGRGKIRLGFGLRGGAPRELLVGFGICTLAMAGIFCAEWALGAIEVRGIGLEIGILAANFGFLVLIWAPFEETLRMLMLNGMRAVFRRDWIAIALASVVFGLIHAANDHATAAVRDEQRPRGAHVRFGLRQDEPYLDADRVARRLEFRAGDAPRVPRERRGRLERGIGPPGGSRERPPYRWRVRSRGRVGRYSVPSRRHRAGSPRGAVGPAPERRT